MAIGINLDSDDCKQIDVFEHSTALTKSEWYRYILKRLVDCADNGFATAELHDIVQSARKAL